MSRTGGKALRVLGLERRVRDPYGCDGVLERVLHPAPPKVGHRPTFFYHLAGQETPHGRDLRQGVEGASSD